MRTVIKAEYEQIRKEIKDVQDCITEYVKRYFEVGVIVIGAVWYLQKDIPNSAKIAPDAYAYVCLLLSYVILAFSGILFHKFNTHNRYAGYARALAREVWPKAPPYGVDEIHLWESVLEPLILATVDLAKVPDDVRPDHKEATDISISLEKEGPWNYLKRSLYGLLMMIRAPLRRVETKSWTYAYNIGFALFFPSAFLVLVWSEILYKYPPWAAGRSGLGEIDPINPAPLTVVEFLVNLAALVYLVCCWLGMGHRMFRLCGLDGDRTVAFYNKYFQVRRRLALRVHDIDVHYAGPTE